MIHALRKYFLIYANVAHLVERHLAKVEVASSSLVVRSRPLLISVRVFVLYEDK